MRSMSAKTRKRIAECRPFRLKIREEVGRCEMCGIDPIQHRSGGCLSVHEICRGAHRLKALDKRYAVLVLCSGCHNARIHNGPEKWPEARQLALLKRSRPQDMDLPAYNALVGYGPNRITALDVETAEV